MKKPDPRGVTVMSTKINIIMDENHEIKAKPENVLTRVSDTLEFHLHVDPDTGVTVSGNDNYPGSGWIQGSGMGGGHIEVFVSRDLDVPEEPGVSIYGYDIVVDGVGELDPMVIVKR